MSLYSLGLKQPLLAPKPLGQKFAPLQPPSPLGFSQTPLGETVETADFLSFSFDEGVNPLRLSLSEQSREVESTDNQEFQSLRKQKKKDDFSSTPQNTELISLQKQPLLQTTENQTDDSIVQAKPENQQNLTQQDFQPVPNQSTSVEDDSAPQNTGSIDLQKKPSSQSTQNHLDDFVLQAKSENQPNLNQIDLQPLSNQSTSVEDDSTPQNTESVNLQKQPSSQQTQNQTDDSVARPKPESQLNLSQQDSQPLSTQSTHVEDHSTSQNTESINLQKQPLSQPTENQTDDSIVQPKSENQLNLSQQDSQPLSTQLTQVEDDSTPQNIESINLQKQHLSQATENQTDDSVVRPKLENQQNLTQQDFQPLPTQPTSVEDDSTRQNTESINLQKQSSSQPTQNQTDDAIVQAKLENQLNLSQQDSQPLSTQPTSVENDSAPQNTESINLQKQPSPTESTNIQLQLNNQSLPVVKPLAKSSSIVDESNFQLSELFGEFSEQTPDTSNEKPRLSDPDSSKVKLTENREQVDTGEEKALNEQAVNLKTSDVPESWSNISELLDLNSHNPINKTSPDEPLGVNQSPNHPSNLILRNLDLQSEQTREEETREKERNSNHPNLQTKQQTKKQTKNTSSPDSWSNISELLGENITSSPDISNSRENDSSPVSLLVSSAFSDSVSEKTSSSIELASSFASNSIDSTLINSDLENNSVNPQEIKTDIEEQLEFIAQDIYKLLRQKLEIDLEREGKKLFSYPTWFYHANSMTKKNNKQKNNSEISLLDNQFKYLSEEVYLMIQQRLKIELSK